MRKDSISIFSISVLITVAIIGTAYYMSVIRPIDKQALQTRPDAIPADPGAVGNLLSSQPAEPAWTDTPIKCFDEKVGKFWTNASNCDNADLDNRLSITEPLKKINDTSYAAGDTRNKITAPKRARRNKAPHLRCRKEAVACYSSRVLLKSATIIGRPLSHRATPTLVQRYEVAFPQIY